MSYIEPQLIRYCAHCRATTAPDAAISVSGKDVSNFKSLVCSRNPRGFSSYICMLPSVTNSGHPPPNSSGKMRDHEVQSKQGQLASRLPTSAERTTRNGGSRSEQQTPRYDGSEISFPMLHGFRRLQISHRIQSLNTVTRTSWISGQLLRATKQSKLGSSVL